MQQSPKIRRLVTLLSRLPGVGEKTAQRYVLHLLTADAQISRDLGAELVTLHDELRPCERCGNIAEVVSEAGPDAAQEVTCAICKDDRRDARVLCVVGRVHDLMAIERTGAMRGRYFVLGRLLSPLEGIGPEDLPLPRLVARIKAEGVTEVIVATPPSVDGEATALLLKRELAPLSITMTRIASGVPHGGDLEYADPITMGRALAGRQSL
ncbi:MAG: recombination protein RecR [Deltaproteobacteria bacterium]|nr:recombination protein RecR [Deltaproteobacteria bacterium]